MNTQIISSISNDVVPVSGVPLFSSEFRGYNPDKLISFIDLTSNIIENNPNYNYYEVINHIEDTVEYLLPKKFIGYGSGSLIITDRYTESKYIDFKLPLYYQYQLMYDSYITDVTLPEGSIVVRKNQESVVSYDNYIIENRENPVSSGRYNTDISGSFVWSNKLINSNVITNRLLLPIREKDYFYTVEYNKYIDNSITEYYNELISEVPLYSEGYDYNITPSSIILTENSRIPSGSFIFIQRDPQSFIYVNKPISSTDVNKDNPWNFTITCGEIINSSGLLGGYTPYKITNYNSLISASGLSTIETPKFVNKNVIKTNTSPLFISQSGYPDYNINETIISLTSNNKNIKDNIISIDYNNGYIYLDNTINISDNLSIQYTYDASKLLLSTNVDLNPKNSINNDIDIVQNPIGLVLTPSGTIFSSGSAPTNVVNWSKLAYYNFNDCIDGDFITSSGVIGYAVESVITNPISGIIPENSKLLGFFSVNTITPDSLKLYDLRRHGGYNEKDVIINSSGWRGFSDIGFYDGEAFPSAGSLLIQIPSIIYNEIYNKFNENINTNESNIEEVVKKYINDTIKRYLPLGYFYIIIDENFNVIDKLM